METSTPTRNAYPTDVSDEEWEFVAPYLSLLSEDAPQRRHELREVFNGLRFISFGAAADESRTSSRRRRATGETATALIRPDSDSRRTIRCGTPQPDQ
jgi:hypothetical protein